MLRYITIYITLLFFLPALAHAQGRVGVFVWHSNQSSKSACVQISADEISGKKLLEKSGFNPVFDRGFLVELDGERSQSGWEVRNSDNFWYSYLLANGSWQNVNSGASSLKLSDGQIYGWQNHAGSLVLPQISFEQVCKNEKSAENTVLSESPLPQETQNQSSGSFLKPKSPTPKLTPSLTASTATTREVHTQTPVSLDSAPDHTHSFYWYIVILALMGSAAGYLLALRR